MREEEMTFPDVGTLPAQLSPSADAPLNEDVAAAAPVSVAKGRFIALDLLRFLAVVLMVQGHTFREVLEMSLREERWHGYHNYIHGYTAPIFLFSSGLAFGITTFRSWDKHLSFGPTLLKRLERYALLLLIGYAIHMPSLSLHALMNTPRESLELILKVDALQNIGVMLAIAELSVVALRTQKRFIAFIASLALVMVLIAPALWRLDLTGVPLFFTGYINASTRSIFPLAPWGVFLLAGILTAAAIWDREARAVRPRAHLYLLAVGVATVFIGRALSQSDLGAIFGEHNYWKTSPFFFLVRIGAVWCVLSLLMFVGRLIRQSADPSKKNLIQTLGAETLVIYVAHLFVLYGSPFNQGVVRAFGPTLDVVESSLLFGAIFAVMIALAFAWHWVKTTYPKSFDLVRRTVTVALIAVFLLSS